MIKLPFEELLKISLRYRELSKKKPFFTTSELKEYLESKKLLNQYNINFEKVRTIDEEELKEYIQNILSNPDFEREVLERVNLGMIEKIEDKRIDTEQLLSESGEVENISDREYLTSIIQDNIDGIVEEARKVRSKIKEVTEETLKIVTGSKFRIEIDNGVISIIIPKKISISIEPSLLIELYKKTFNSNIIEIEKEFKDETIIEDSSIENNSTEEVIEQESTPKSEQDEIFEKVALNVTFNKELGQRKRSGYKLPTGNVYYSPFNVNRLTFRQYEKYYSPYTEEFSNISGEEVVARIFDIKLNEDGSLPKNSIDITQVKPEQLILMRLFAGLKFSGIVSTLKALSNSTKDEDSILRQVSAILLQLPEDDIVKIFSSDVLAKIKQYEN